MKFVKASERLPEYDDVVHVKIDGHRKMGNFYEDEHGSTWFYAMATSSGNDWHVPPHKLNGIEWLDESEQDEGWVLVEQFADFMDTERNKGLDGRAKGSAWDDDSIWGTRKAFKLMFKKFKEKHHPPPKIK